jgi:hypothetical protein
MLPTKRSAMALARGAAPSRNVQEECRAPDDTAPDDTAPDDTASKRPRSARRSAATLPCAAVVRAGRTGAVGLVAERLPWVTAGLDDL